MNKKKEPTLSTEKAKLDRYHVACAAGAIASTPQIKLFCDSSFDIETLNSTVLAAIERREEADGMTPISSIFDCDGDVLRLAAALSDEQLQFLKRPAAKEDIYTFSSHTSFIKAEAFVRDNPGTTIQYGWLLFGRTCVRAIFHAAVRTETGDIILIDETIPGLAFERTIAFIPDSVNAPDYLNCSVPTDVWLGSDHRGPILRVTEIVRGISDIDGAEPCYWHRRQGIPIPLVTSIFRAGLAPHEPSEILDAQRMASCDEMLRREENTRKRFKSSMKKRNLLDLERKYA